ncbi:MAG TPA: hypothetical protein VGP72_10950 [Planctomycetota bacterium]
MKKRKQEEMDDQERCRRAREALGSRFKTLKEYGDFIRKEEKKTPKNMIAGKRLLARIRRLRRKQGARAPRTKLASRRSA